MSRLIQEMMRDRPHVLIRGGNAPVTATGEAYDVSRQGRHADHLSADNHPHPGQRGLQHRVTRTDPTNAVQIPAANVGAWNGPTTVSIWLKGAFSSTNDTYQCVGGDANRFLNYFNRPTTGRMTCYWGANNESEALVSGADHLWNDGRWHLWTWVRDTAPATPLLSIYRDGALSSSRNEAGAAPLASSQLKVFGSPSVGQPNLEWTCLAMWARALSPVRIRAHYRAGVNMVGAPLRVGV